MKVKRKPLFSKTTSDVQKHVRLTQEEFITIKKRAALYANGNASLWMRMASLLYIPARVDELRKKR